MRALPYLATQVPEIVGHAREVSKRRRLHGPQLPGWGYSYELFVALFRTRFAEADLPPAIIRARFDALGTLVPLHPRINLRVIAAHGVPCSIIAPRRPSKRWVLYLHGGAYVFGSSRSHAPMLARLARSTGASILAVDYRLAPEHPCPAALDDALAAWRWLLEQGVDPREVVIAGDSAGGGLALATLLALRDQGGPLPARALLLSPWTDLALSGESPTRATHDFLPNAQHLRTFAARYYGELGPLDPRVSPLYAPDLSGLPPTLILAGGEEAILDDSTRIHERLREAGVAAQLHVEAHEVHVYPMFAAISQRAQAGVEQIAGFIS